MNPRELIARRALLACTGMALAGCAAMPARETPLTQLVPVTARGLAPGVPAQ